MRFEGIHHITCITADAPGNVDFYVRVLGLRLVKKSVNQDDPTVYHLFYADEKGSAGSDLTFFEYPHARRGRAGAGMVHRIVFRVGSDENTGPHGWDIDNLVFNNITNNQPFASALALVPIVVMIAYLLVARRLGAFEHI